MAEPIYIGYVLSPQKCGQLMDETREHLKEVTLQGYSEGQNYITKKHMEYRYEEDTKITFAIKEFAALISCGCITDIEPIKVTRYRPGDFFGNHHDGKHRRATLLVYLNAGYSGGHTVFPELKKSYTPSLPGEGLFWPNSPNYVHSSQEVLSGEKWVATAFVKR